MENKSPGPSKGYQKQLKKEVKDTPPPKAKRDLKDYTPDYSSPTAKKWPLLLEALQNGKADVVKQLIEEGINVNLIRDGSSPLMMAASKGQTELAEIFLQAGVNVNAKNDDGWTALHKAAFDQAETGIIDLLLQSGIDSETRNKSGKTALNMAEEKGHREIVRVIKKHQQQLRIDAQEWEDFLNTPEGKPWQQKRRYESLALPFKLWWLPPLVLGCVGLLLGLLIGAIILSGFIGIVAGFLIGLPVLLLEKKMRNYLDDIGPLPYLDINTLREKRKSGEKILIKKENKTKSIEETPGAQPVYSAANEQKAHRTLIEEGAKGNAQKLKKKGNLRIVICAVCALVIVMLSGAILYHKTALTQWYYAKKLESKGIPFSEQAFLDEVSRDHEEAVGLFLKAGMRLDAKNEKGQTAFIIASEKGEVNILRKLVALNATSLNYFDKSGNTALMTAARQGQGAVVQLLFESGADVNYMVPSDDGAASALQAALDSSDFKEEHMNIVKYLLQHGAQVKGRNKAGQFPLLFAADHGRTEAAKLLIESGADVNEVDLNGHFPLLVAACKGHSGLVTLLADKNANMQMTLPDGNSPLMCAAQEGRVDTVRTLLEKGANVNAKTTSGLTALTYATGTGNVVVVKLLLEQGADPGYGHPPDSFLGFRGKAIALRVKKSKIKDLLKRIAKTASQDGYTIDGDPTMEQTITITTKASWNKVLNELAKKNHLLLVVKEKEVFVLPYDAAKVKREIP